MGEILRRFVFCICMIASAYSSAYCGPFADVPQNHWAYRDIMFVSIKFEPEALPWIIRMRTQRYDPTRYEVAVIIARVFEKFPACDFTKDGNPKKCKTELRNQLGNVTPDGEIDEFTEIFERLTKEFKDEFAALGVRVTIIDDPPCKGYSGFEKASKENYTYSFFIHSGFSANVFMRTLRQGKIKNQAKQYQTLFPDIFDMLYLSLIKKHEIRKYSITSIYTCW